MAENEKKNRERGSHCVCAESQCVPPSLARSLTRLEPTLFIAHLSPFLHQRLNQTITAPPSPSRTHAPARTRAFLFYSFSVAFAPPSAFNPALRSRLLLLLLLLLSLLFTSAFLRPRVRTKNWPLATIRITFFTTGDLPHHTSIHGGP